MRTPNPKTLLKMVIAVMVVDTIVPVGVAYSIGTSSDAQNRAHSAQIAQYQTCLAGNQYREDDMRLWQQVVALVDGTSRAGKAFDRNVLAIVARVDAPRVCKTPSS